MEAIRLRDRIVDLQSTLAELKMNAQRVNTQYQQALTSESSDPERKEHLDSLQSQIAAGNEKYEESKIEKEKLNRGIANFERKVGKTLEAYLQNVIEKAQAHLDESQFNLMNGVNRELLRSRSNSRDSRRARVEPYTGSLSREELNQEILSGKGGGTAGPANPATAGKGKSSIDPWAASAFGNGSASVTTTPAAAPALTPPPFIPPPRSTDPTPQDLLERIAGLEARRLEDVRRQNRRIDSVQATAGSTVDIVQNLEDRMAQAQLHLKLPPPPKGEKGEKRPKGDPPWKTLAQWETTLRSDSSHYEVCEPDIARPKETGSFSHAGFERIRKSLQTGSGGMGY